MSRRPAGERRASTCAYPPALFLLTLLATACGSSVAPGQDTLADADAADTEVSADDAIGRPDGGPIDMDATPVDTTADVLSDADGRDTADSDDVGLDQMDPGRDGADIDAESDGVDAAEDAVDADAERADTDLADAAEGSADLRVDPEDTTDASPDAADVGVDTEPMPECTSHLMCERLQACEDAFCVGREGSPCESHDVCGYGGACEESVCVDRRTVRGTVVLSPLTTTLLTEHFMFYPGRREPFGNGRGGAVLDFDGDGLLDLFISGIPEVGTQSCLYRNVSGEEVQFETTSLCETLGRVDGAAATDLDRDGVHELATFAFEAVNHWSWDGTEWSSVELYPLIEAAGLGCSAGGGTMLDADRDGDLDLLVHCQHDRSAIPVGFANVVLEVEDEEFVGAWSSERAEFLADDGLTLAVLVSDLNEDGLTDLVVLDDTFSSDGVVNTTWEPGGIVWGCSPLEDCEWRKSRLGSGTRAWGSFMGAASLRLFDGSELLYLSDLGLDRLVNVASGEVPESEAQERGVAARPRDDAIFTWGSFTEDLDQNGLDDVFVVTGDGIPERIAGGRDIGHIDRHVMQTTDGLSLVFRPEFAPGSEPVFSGRFCAAVDFNTDGLLEFATTPFVGNVRLETEAAPEWGGLRSALVPTTRVVHQLGARFEVWSETGWQRRATHGQPRSTSSPYLTVPEGRARIRFPSGGVVETFIEGPGPHAIEEPAWLEVSREGSEVRVDIDSDHWDGPIEQVAIAHRTDDGTVLIELSNVEGTWSGVAESGTTMVRINDRWVERWWP